MTRKPKLEMTGKQLLALREKHGLTQVQIALLLRMRVSVRPNQRGQSDRVGKWENGNAPIPVAVAETLRAKLYLLEVGLPFDTLLESSLEEILRDFYS
jgi:transcriptional regulator with XRE-family HTH domain